MIHSIFELLKNLFTTEHVHRDSDRAGVISDEEIRQRKVNAASRNLISF
jgi:hypothetical protein